MGSQAIVVAQINLLMLNYEFPPIGGGAANAHLCLLKQYADNTDLKVDVLTSAQTPGFFEERFCKNINWRNRQVQRHCSIELRERKL